MPYHDSDFSVPTGNKNCGITISTKKEKEEEKNESQWKSSTGGILHRHHSLVLLQINT